MNIQQASLRWGVTPRSVQELCKNGTIEGACRFGRAWMIPDNSIKPADGRSVSAKKDRNKKRDASALAEEDFESLPMPRKNPFLIFTNLYTVPGTADKVVSELSKDQPEAAKLFQTQLDYLRGNFDSIYRDANYFLEKHTGFNAVVGAGFQLAYTAIWTGDINLWQKARQHIYEAPCKDDEERKVQIIWLAAIDSMVNDADGFPDWFRKGNFDCFPIDSHCSARFIYAKGLYIAANKLAKGELVLKDVSGMGLMRTLPYIIEPMISYAKAEKTVCAEICLHLLVATAYHNLGENERAIPHIDRAIELCLPDGLLAYLVEYMQGLDGLLEERLALADSEAVKKAKDMHSVMIVGWTKLHNELYQKNLSTSLTVREREVAKLAAFGFSNAEIARRLHIEVSSVKRYVFSAMNKVGAEKRSELGLFI